MALSLATFIIYHTFLRLSTKKQTKYQKKVDFFYFFFFLFGLPAAEQGQNGHSFLFWFYFLFNWRSTVSLARALAVAALLSNAIIWYLQIIPAYIKRVRLFPLFSPLLLSR